MTLPAITLCFNSSSTYSTNLTLENCTISGTECSPKDFYSFETVLDYRRNITCYVLNGGRNSSGHFVSIKKTENIGYESGILLNIVLPKQNFLNYYINDAHVRPTIFELENHLFISGEFTILRLEKTIETKLEYPHSKCRRSENFPDSIYINQLTKSNVTYRQVNCFELCLKNFVRSFALEKNISEFEANSYFGDFDLIKNCEHLCPLECEITSYSVKVNSYSIAKKLDDLFAMSSILVNKQEQMLTNNNSNQLILNIGFDSLKYNKITQSPKITLSGLISNIGGSSGVFLELSFPSICRAVDYFLRIIFKF